MDHSEVKHLPKVDHTPADLDDVSKLLLKAAALIEEKGHCQTGLGTDRTGRVCVMIALSGISGSASVDLWGRAESRLGKYIPEVQGKPSLSKVARWSDGTPTAQVLAKLRAVALGL